MHTFKSIFLRSLLASILAFSSTAVLALDKNTQIYGSYNAGCIKNAIALPLNSKDYQVQISNKGRNYGHPMMLDFVKTLIKRAKEHNLPPLLFSDISLKHGGPFGKGSNHASHNIGLDIDIPFDFSSPRKTKSELKRPKDVYLVRNDKLTKDFDKKRILLIYLAATDDRVERIFVSPRIKEGMCNLYGSNPKNDAWLAKLRPWFGHKAHMHVRLQCPKDSPNCIKQASVPSGNGCGYELMSWFLPPDPNAKKQSLPKKKKTLPYQCNAILGK